jgi:hypothetical protein
MWFRGKISQSYGSWITIVIFLSNLLEAHDYGASGARQQAKAYAKPGETK